MKTSTLIVLVLGVAALYVSPKVHHMTHVQQGIAIGIVVLVALIVGGLVHLTFGSRKKDKQKQSGGFGYATRTGRS